MGLIVSNSRRDAVVLRHHFLRCDSFVKNAHLRIQYSILRFDVNSAQRFISKAYAKELSNNSPSPFQTPMP